MVMNFNGLILFNIDGESIERQLDRVLKELEGLASKKVSLDSSEWEEKARKFNRLMANCSSEYFKAYTNSYNELMAKTSGREDREHLIRPDEDGFDILKIEDGYGQNEN